MNELLEIKKVSLAFGKRKILKQLSFSISKGEVVCVIGESGSGKTTLLNVIQGLVDLGSGEVLFNSSKVLGPSEVLVAGHNGISTVYQDFRLQEGLTVENNLKHELIHLSVRQQNKICNKALRDCQLYSIRKNFPREVSGGQRQKLALAKALINEPELILLDEPFSNLDSISKSSFKSIINSLKQKGLSFLYVTHDVIDAVSFADRIIVIKEGEIERDVVSFKLFNDINSVYVANLLGLTNIYLGSLLNELFVFDNLLDDSKYLVPFQAIRFNTEKGVWFKIVTRVNLGDVFEYHLIDSKRGCLSLVYKSTNEINLDVVCVSIDEKHLRRLKI